MHRRASAPAIPQASAAALQMQKSEEEANAKANIIELVKLGLERALRASEQNDSTSDAFDWLAREAGEKLEVLFVAHRDFARKQLHEQQIVHDMKLETSRKAGDVSLKEKQVAMEASFSRQMDSKMAAFAAASGQDALLEATTRIEELSAQLQETAAKLARTEEDLEASRDLQDQVDTLEKELREKTGRIGELQVEANAAKAAAAASEESALAAKAEAAAAIESTAMLQEELENKSFGLSAVLAIATVFRQKRKNALVRVEAAERSLGVVIEERDALANQLMVNDARSLNALTSPVLSLLSPLAANVCCLARRLSRRRPRKQKRWRMN